MGAARCRLWFSVLLIIVSFLAPSVGSGAESAQGKRMKMPPVPGKKVPAREGQAGKGTSESAVVKIGSGEPSPGQINARSAILVEVSTGAVLFEQNADEVIEPASFTKIASLYMVFDGLRQGRVSLADEVWVSETAWRTGGSKMFVGVGTKVPLEELVKGIAVVSGNDACVAAAEHLSGSVDAFVDAMNRKARELGMNNTHFLNPHGLPADGQVTTARDMALLDSSYLKRFPDALRFHSMREYTYNNITQYNRNRLLLKDSTVDGLKTGFVTASGYHLAATARRDGMRLLAVVMGASTPAIREREALKLLNFGFRYYSLVQPFPEGQPLATVKVWKGVKDEVGLFPAEAPSFLIPQAKRNLLRWEVHAPSELTAPVEAQHAYGEVVFYVSDEAKRNVPLVTEEEVPLGGWLKRFWHALLRIHKVDWRWVSGISGAVALTVIFVMILAGRRSASRRPRSFRK